MIFLKDKIVKARKNHQCEWCCKPILKGLDYRSQATIQHGNLCVQKWHLACIQDCEMAVHTMDITEEDNISVDDLRCMWNDKSYGWKK